MKDIANRIAAIIAKRHSLVPIVRSDLNRWKAIDSNISDLGTAINELRSHPHTPYEIKDGLMGFQIQDIKKGIAEVIELLQILEARYSRETINVGVSGRARVGKSTLLQQISGLGEQQIPTGSGLPVTAVRSRIFHSTTHHRATLSLHSFDSFREDVLMPYHDDLDLPEAPSSIETFRSWVYPKSEVELSKSAREKHSSITTLRRLRDMQNALWSFEKDLTGGERTVNLEDLQQYVAYPKNDEIDSDQCSRRYLAVRDVCIECTFPHTQVDRLGIVDLPGLGELAANAEKYHLSGLQNEVDAVLLLKRPVEGMGYWGKEDGNAVNLLDRARGFIKNRRDFVFIVLNHGKTSADQVQSLRDDIRRQVNDGADGKHFQVLETDATDKDAVYEAVITPLLQHLVDRLPVMDNEVFEGTRSKYISVKDKILLSLSDLESVLAQASSSGGSATEDVEYRTVELRKDIAAALAVLVNELGSRARSGDEDPDFISAVDAIYDGIQVWIETGFGAGKDAWVSDALRTMRVDHNSSPVAGAALNRIRVDISKRYSSLDNYFRGRVDELWSNVAAIVSQNLGDLLELRTGEGALKGLSALLNDASEPCPDLREAVNDLLELRVEYRTHLHPRIRRELDGLNLQVRDPESGDYVDQIVVPVTEAGAEQMFRTVTQLAQQAAYLTKKALINEALTPTLVLHAAAEQFEDSLIRSGNSEREFRRLARSYRDEIWPGVYQGIDQANARFAKVKKSIRAVRDSLGNVEGNKA